MAKAKLKLKRRKKEQTKASGPLPPQEDKDIQLVDTDTKTLLDLEAPAEFRTSLVETKCRFIDKIKSISKNNGMDVMVRVYFTFNIKE